jgi:uncharacterized glyoxalase superfamily protein PhnB
MDATLDAVGLVSEDLPRTIAFYRELGIDLPPDTETRPHVEVTLPSGLRLLFDTADTIRSFDPDWQPPSGGTRIGLAFRCDSPAEVDALYDKIVALGYDGHKAPWDAPWGQRYALLRDPDGNGVDLFAPNPDPVDA